MFLVSKFFCNLRWKADSLPGFRSHSISLIFRNLSLLPLWLFSPYHMFKLRLNVVLLTLGARAARVTVLGLWGLHTAKTIYTTM